MILLWCPTTVSSENVAAAKEITTTSTTTSTVPLVDPGIVKLWEKVAWCETHGDWDRDMPLFDGGLGISRVVWNEYGGQELAPAPHLATKEEQVFIGRRIQARAGVPNLIPDQDGACRGW